MINQILQEENFNKMKIIITESQLKSLVENKLKMDEMAFTYDDYKNLSHLKEALDKNQVVGVAFVKNDGDVRHMLIKRYISSYVPSEKEKTEKQINLQRNNNVKRVIDFNLYRKNLKELRRYENMDEKERKEKASHDAWRTINLEKVLGFSVGRKFIDLREENDIMEKYGEYIYNQLTDGMKRRIEEDLANAQQEDND